MRLGWTIAGLWLAALVATPTPHAATDPAAGCAAAKRKAVGKCAFETLKCHAEAARRSAFVEPRCREKAEARLAQAFARAEQRGGCATSGDASALQAEVDVFVEGVVAALPTSPPPTVTTTSSTTTSTTTMSSTTTTTLECTGASVGGHCWYQDPFGPSCDQVCAAVSRTYDPATESFAGSGGSDANCAAVVQAVWGLSNPYPVNPATCSSGVGCGWTVSVLLPVVHRCTVPPTTGAATDIGFHRFCACR